MGLFKKKKKAFSKFDDLTKSDAKQVARKMDPKDKVRFKKYVEDMEHGGKSINKIGQDLEEIYGKSMKRKFMKEAEKFKGGGLTEAQKKRNIQESRESSGQGEMGYQESEISFGMGKVKTSSRVSSMGDNEVTEGFQTVDEDSRSRVSALKVNTKKGFAKGDKGAK